MAKMISDSEFERQFEAAAVRGKQKAKSEVRAGNVSFDTRERTLAIELPNGVKIILPAESLAELRGADEKAIANFVLSPSGNSLHWRDLNVDLSIGAAINDVLGREILAEYGRQGGSVTSEAKSTAARENGKKGGRPSKYSSTTIELQEIPYERSQFAKHFEIAQIMPAFFDEPLSIREMVNSELALREYDPTATVPAVALDLFGLVVPKDSSVVVANMPVSGFSQGTHGSRMTENIGDCNAELALTA